MTLFNNVFSYMSDACVCISLLVNKSQVLVLCQNASSCVSSTTHVSWYSHERTSRFLSDFIKNNLCSEDERRSYGFRMTRGWVNNDKISIFGWSIQINNLFVLRLLWESMIQHYIFFFDYSPEPCPSSQHLCLNTWNCNANENDKRPVIDFHFWVFL